MTICWVTACALMIGGEMPPEKPAAPVAEFCPAPSGQLHRLLHSGSHGSNLDDDDDGDDDDSDAEETIRTKKDDTDFPLIAHPTLLAGEPEGSAVSTLVIFSFSSPLFLRLRNLRI